MHTFPTVFGAQALPAPWSADRRADPGAALPLVLPGADQGWRHAACYWMAALGGLLTPHRLRPERARRYGAPVTISDALVARWHRLFGIDGSAGVPLLYNQSVGTLLYMAVFADLGLNVRHLLHLQHRTVHHAGVAACAAARQQRLVCGLRRALRLGEDRALVELETQILDAGGAPLATVVDAFMVRRLPAADVRALPSDRHVTRELIGLRRRRAQVDPASGDAWRRPLPIGRHLGRAYGQVSGDRNPVHTTAFGAWLFGLPRPFLQGLGLRSLVVRELALDGTPIDRLEMTFASPAYLGQMLGLVVDGDRFEEEDAAGTLVAFGRAGAAQA